MPQTNEWITLNKSNNFSDSNGENGEIEIETIFFLDKKCFQIKKPKSNSTYTGDQFLRNGFNNEVLKIYFNEQLINQDNLIVHLMSRIKGKAIFKNNELSFTIKRDEQTF